MTDFLLTQFQGIMYSVKAKNAFFDRRFLHVKLFSLSKPTLLASGYIFSHFASRQEN
jgi:hypothetical protein